MENIRNFCIIAHIDHGKSTLADRLIETCKTVSTRDMTCQKMDKVHWDAGLRTNLDRLYTMSQQVEDSKAERGGGRVINVSSVNGSKGANAAMSIQ